MIVTIARGDNGPDVTAKAVPLNRRAFADVLAAAMQKAALESADEWHRRAGPLAAALFEPIAARLAGRDRLLIVPDDLLWKVPFEALPRAEGEPEPFVTYATSLATLAVQRSLAPATSPRVPAFLAAPAIPDAIRAQLTLTLPSWKPQDTEAALNAARSSWSP